MQTKTAGMQNHALTLTASATSAANTTQLSTLPTSMWRQMVSLIANSSAGV